MQLPCIKVLGKLKTAKWLLDGIAHVVVWILVNIPQFTTAWESGQAFAAFVQLGFAPVSGGWGQY